MKIKAVIQVHSIAMLSEYKPSLLGLENTLITVIISDGGWVETKNNPELKIHVMEERQCHNNATILDSSEYTILLSKPYED